MWWCWVALAWGWETDPLTARDRPPAESLMALDAEMNRVLAEVVAQVNVDTRCRGTERRKRRLFADALHERVSSGVHLDERGFVRGQGYDAWGHWMETSPEIDRVTLMPDETIFGDLTALDSPILALGGTCSMFTVAGYYLGSDKFDHFLSEGHDYFTRSQDGRRPDRATRWGVSTELHLYGLDTSLTFSYADLEANFAGYTFYSGLLREGSPVQLEPEHGCLVIDHLFTWTDYMQGTWDEARNPPVFQPHVAEAVARRIRERPDVYCPVWQALGGAEYQAQLTVIMGEPQATAPGRVPERLDPFGLTALCTEPEPTP